MYMYVYMYSTHFNDRCAKKKLKYKSPYIDFGGILKFCP